MSNDQSPAEAVEAPKRFSAVIHAQIAGDAGEAGARVRKNSQRNAQAGPQRKTLRSGVENDEELKPRVVKRVRRKGKGAVEEAG